MNDRALFESLKNNKGIATSKKCIATSSFLLLVEMHLATRSFLLLVAMHLVTSSFLLAMRTALL